MAGLAFDYRYVYPFQSALDTQSHGPNLSLSTCEIEESNPYYFEGRLVRPYLTARLLQDLSALVRTRFFMQIDPLVLDPVVTSHGDFIRFEVFSGCCSLYARLDLPPATLDGENKGRGTTNVDFNPPMLAALGRVSKTDDLRLSLGADEIVLARSDQSVIEKKVKLPLRWLKSFTAVTSYSKRLEPVYKVDSVVANRFLKSIPRSVDNKVRWWIAQSGKSLRVSLRQSKGAVAAGALNRLRIFENNSVQAKSLTIYGHPDVDASGWELDFGDARFTVVMTHDVWRGFSGEGQGLLELSSKPVAKVLNPVTAALRWQSILDRSEFDSAALTEQQFELGLDYLSTLGQVGFDLNAGKHFHRQLPFDFEFVTKLQPRYKSAQKLVDSGAIKSIDKDKASGLSQFTVRSTDVTHTVQLGKDTFKCTCPWIGKHANRRGPCKHVLAVYLTMHGATEDN